ncbi:MAG TPA: rhodanese-like domain-containing protein [Trueperaceae bacterium]
MTNGRPAASSVKEMVSEARSRIENLSPEQVEEELKQGALLVDIRERDEIDRSGAIPGASHYPRGMLEFWADPASPYHKEDLDPERRIILHCASGGRSALAADMMRSLGFGRVAHMDGGFQRWKQEGRRVEEGSG